jgi:DNA repair protein RadA/Sms
MKKKAETVFVCNNCGNEFAKWAGQCSGCGEWNSLKEITNYLPRRQAGELRTIKSVTNLGEEKKVTTIKNIFSSEMKEVDRVLGKGFVQGQVVLFAGEPGIGKSTILTQLLGKVPGLYVAGEETAEQIGLRVDRLGINRQKFNILETNLVADVSQELQRTKNLYKIVVVDSIQMMQSENVASTLGSVPQIRQCTFELVELAKKTGMVIIIVGHVTKEGDIAGPKILEHMVDTVLYFEGERNGDLRILRVDKNRFGPTDEVGVFKMEEKGLREIDGNEISLIDNKDNQIGSTVTLIMEGTRSVLVEIQALVTESFGNMPKRVFSGIDYNRGQLLVAVTQKVLGIPLYKYDVFISVGGGVKINDCGSDLAIVGAIYSSYKNKAIENSNNRVLVGEVSLLGQVRKVRQMEKRIKEAKAMGREVVTIYSIRELK